jgi:hypothetical protein
MKIRSSILVFIIVVVAAIALLLWYGKKKPVETSPQASVETNVPLQAVTVPSQPAIPPAHAAPSPANPIASTVAVTPASQMEKAIGILSTYNDVPIDFYGRLEDQFSNAVAGAAVNFSVRIMNGHEFSSKGGQVTSDADGFFTISGYKGQDLNFVPQKAGYVLATSSTLFKYSHLEDHPFTSDLGNPTVIRMWKLQGSEPLVSINQRYKFHYTDAPINFDLLTGKIVPNDGDIQITVERSSGIISGRTRLDWGVQVGAVNGGLVEPSSDEFAYQAPADGYQQSAKFIMSTNAPYKWLGGFDQTFFLQSRNGQVFSKVNFSITINQEPDDYVWVEFHGVANTNGSRNWEATAPQ